MLTFLRRFVGALALLPYVYEEVEADTKSLPSALLVVCISTLATGAAYFDEAGLQGVLAGAGLAILAWLLWTWMTYHIGTRWLPTENTEADWGQLLRTTGFAFAPGVFRVLGFIPEARDPLLALTSVWTLAAFVVAVRQALDYESTWRALAVCLIGWALYTLLLFILPWACTGGDVRL